MAERTGEPMKVSLPLYLAALAATLCGVMTVANSVANSLFTQEVVTLTVLGFLFSLGCRALKINARLLEGMCLSLIVIGIAGVLSGRLPLGALLPAGVMTNDTRVAVALCWGAVLLSWAILHDSTALFTPLLSVAAIGLVASSNVNAYVEDDFCGLMIATIFLLMHYHLLHLRACASPVERARPMPHLVTTQLAVAVVGTFCVIFLGAAFIVPVEAVSKNLSIAGAIGQLALKATHAAGGAKAFLFTDNRDLPIGMGDGSSASKTVLMRVTPSDGLPHLWQGRTYDYYNGDGWQSTLPGNYSLSEPPVPTGTGVVSYDLPTKSYPDRPAMTAFFHVLGVTNEFYYSPEPRTLSLAMETNAVPIIGADGRITLANQQSLGNMEYEVVSQLALNPMDPQAQAKLRHAGNRYPAAIRNLYLGNMSDGGYPIEPQAMDYFRKAIAEAFHGLPEDEHQPIFEALALRRWVSKHCVYSLTVAPIPENEDHVYAFLHLTHLGYCDLFASSMAVLCRVAGLPSCVATGFAPGAKVGSSYDLRAMDKHAWTEVYFPKYGWLSFDPTMGSRTDSTLSNLPAASKEKWQTVLQKMGAVPFVLTALILAIIFYVVKKEWYDRRSKRDVIQRRRAPVTPAAAQSYTRLLHILARLGVPRHPAETPHEYARRAQAFLLAAGVGISDREIIQRVTEQFIALRYGASETISVSRNDTDLRVFNKEANRLRVRLLRQRLAGAVPLKKEAK